MIVLLVILVISVVLLSVALVIAIRRLIQFDNFVKFLNDDVNEIILFLRNLVSRDLFSNSPEVLAVHREFKMFLERMESYQKIITESKLSQTEIKKPKFARPVVMD